MKPIEWPHTCEKCKGYKRDTNAVYCPNCENSNLIPAQDARKIMESGCNPDTWLPGLLKAIGEVIRFYAKRGYDFCTYDPFLIPTELDLLVNNWESRMPIIIKALEEAGYQVSRDSKSGLKISWARNGKDAKESGHNKNCTL